MAEFALGLTKTAVAGTVSRVKAAIEEETKLRVRVQNDLVFITGEFEMMQAFLSASSAGERASKNQVVRTWVRQLRDLAFDVEDCVEFVVHLDKPSRWDWVRRLLASSVLQLCCITSPPLPPLDAAVEEIKRLKARVEDISQRNTRYNLISGDDHRPPEHHQVLMRRPGRTSSAAAASTFRVLREVWESNQKLSKTKTTGDLKRLINCDGSNKLQVISLWGSPKDDDNNDDNAAADDDAAAAVGELRWVTAMRKAYCDLEICGGFRNRAWVKSLPHPFNPVEFINNLLTQFKSHHHDFDGGHANLGLVDLMTQLSKHRYLIIIEQELTSIADWDAIRMYLPDHNNGSRIVISTNNFGIAISCTGDPYQVTQLTPLSNHRALYAFSRKDLIHEQEINGSDSSGSESSEEAQYEPDEIVGREDYVRLFREDLTVPARTVCLWGIAGVGKTALGREICNFHGREYNRNGWVDVPYPFNLTDLCRQLLLDFHSDDVSAKESVLVGMMEGQDPIQLCCEFLRRNQCLLVIDGVRSTHDWDMIHATLLSQPFYGTTVAITREESIATYCTDTDDAIINVKGLQHDVALDLFNQTALKGRVADRLSEYLPETQKISELFMSKCGGLPQVLVAIAKFTHAVSTSRYSLVLRDLEDDFMRTLETSLEFQRLRGLFLWMQSYFDACSDELKPCIFYMSVFPADKSIRRRRLLRRWIAEGYSSGGGAAAAAEEKGEKLLRELLKLSILYNEQPASPIRSCKVNGFFCEYIKSRPMEDNLVFALEGSCSHSSRLTGQHLAIDSSWDRDVNVFNSVDLSRLRSLTVFGEWKSFLISERMKLLRVLDLEGTNTLDGKCVTDDDLEEIGKLLHRLKFMSLRGCRQITRLPDSIGDMRQLQTLDVRHTSIVELPSTVITKLHKLQYIRAGTSTDTSIGIPLQTPTQLPIPTEPQASRPTATQPSTPAQASTPTATQHSTPAQTPTPTTTPPSTPTPTPTKSQASTPPATQPSTPTQTSTPTATQHSTPAQTPTSTPPSTPTRTPKQPPTPTPPTSPPTVTPAPPTSQLQPPTPTQQPIGIQEASKTGIGRCMWMASTKSSNGWWQSKKQLDLQRRRRLAANGGGVQLSPAAAKGIGMLTDMHTLGVVNIACGKGALLVLEELKKLTQLRKLGLSGISRKNWRKLCDAISGNLQHLESLSLQLMLQEEEGDMFDFACFDDILEPPKTIKRLKVLYTGSSAAKLRAAGRACIGPFWLKKLPNLERLNHEVTISTQEDMCLLFRMVGTLPREITGRLGMKPTQQHLSFEESGFPIRIRLNALRIDCSSSSSTITFGQSVPVDLEVLNIYCCSSCESLSCLRISGLQHICILKEVRVVGSCSQYLKEELLEQLSHHPHKPVPKLLLICDQ